MLLKINGGRKAIFWVALYLIFTVIIRTLILFGFLIPEHGRLITGIVSIVPFLTLLFEKWIYKN